MIRKINQKDKEIAKEIESLQKLSYRVEAEIIGYSAIPPLEESINDITNSEGVFLAFFEEQQIAGILAYEFKEDFIIISKMMIHPNHFRKGIASNLIDYLFRLDLDNLRVKVATGAKNYPAIRLYQKHGFVKTAERIIDSLLTISTFEKKYSVQQFNEPLRINQLLQNYNRPWFIAGGWAIDLFLGNETRKHGDIEIALLRKDQESIKSYLRSWNLQKVVKGEFHQWKDEYLELPIHEIHGVSETGSRIEILLNESNNSEWIFRREPSIRRHLKHIKRVSDLDIPYLSPEIVLLYKAINPKEKDEEDFIRAKDLLNEESRSWLIRGLEVHIPGHYWIGELVD